jgi:DNA mismatch endonuclease, patch repair protein
MNLGLRPLHACMVLEIVEVLAILLRRSRSVSRQPKVRGAEAISRSENMRRIRSRDTKAELAVRRLLHARGMRYRCHVKELPGKPDLVFSKARVAVFIHGCFWHQHPGCREASRPKSNSDYWLPKLQRNVDRDAAHVTALESLGFEALVYWECDVEDDAEKIATEIESKVRRQRFPTNCSFRRSTTRGS